MISKYGTKKREEREEDLELSPVGHPSFVRGAEEDTESRRLTQKGRRDK